MLLVTKMKPIEKNSFNIEENILQIIFDFQFGFKSIINIILV